MPITMRFKYKKTDELKYIAHLDTLRVFTRAIRRAKLPVSYSKGFNPHPLISFLMPLSLGFTSNCEYVDIGFESIPEGILKTLDAALPDGFIVTDCYEPQDGPVDITACVYRVSFETEIDRGAAEEFFGADELVVDKKSKRGVKQVDIMPMILGHTVYEKEISMTLSAGTVANLNPELVLKNMPIDEDNTYTVCREKIFCGEREFR